MSDIEKELEELTDFDDEELMDEFDDLEDFVDLDDLGSLMDSEDFNDLDELGDLSDLGDLSADSREDGSGAMELPDLDSLGAGDEMFDTVEPEAPSENGGDASLDAMLDGLLDDLDANGSLEKSEEQGAKDAAPKTQTEDDGMNDLLDMLEDADGTADSGGDTPKKKEPEEDILALSDDGEEEPIGEEDMADLLGDIPESLAEGGVEEKKPGLMKKLFGNVVTDEIAEQELAAREAEKEAAVQREEEEAQAKAEAEEAKAAKAEEKAAAKAAKAEEKALKKAAKAEAKAAKKAERDLRREEEAAQAELEVTGKLNKVGVSIIVILTALFLVTEISGTNLFSYRSTMKEAKDYFDMQRYTQAYQEILGTDVHKSDRETYDKIVTVMKVQRSLNAYENYSNMKYYPEALNALLRGLQRYDENIETGRGLEVDGDMASCREQIVTLLEEDFGVSESEAYEILAMKKEAYTKKVVELGMTLQ